MSARVSSAAIVATLALAATAGATPTTVFWAPATPAIQADRVLHVTYDTYFQPDAVAPVDVGLELGLRPSKRLQAEIGFDLLYPTFLGDRSIDFPIVLNARVGSGEGELFKGAPAWSIGVVGVGFEEHATNADVLVATIGKAFARGGAWSIGAYQALEPDLFHSPDGGIHRTGLLAGWTSRTFQIPIVREAQFAWDLQTGQNVLGATGGGVGLTLAPGVSVLLGPVLFFEPDLQPGRARWMWSMQFDADLPLAKPHKPAAPPRRAVPPARRATPRRR